MSYFSEEENELSNEYNEGDEGDISSDSMDEDFRSMFYKADYNNNYELEEETKDKLEPKIKLETKKKECSLSLQNFTKKVDNENKKFVSKRVSDKKPKVVRRGFNPRLPPYNFVRKEKNKELVINDEEFPSL
jgi:hypothetical protein